MFELQNEKRNFCGRFARLRKHYKTTETIRPFARGRLLLLHPAGNVLSISDNLSNPLSGLRLRLNYVGQTTSIRSRFHFGRSTSVWSARWLARQRFLHRKLGAGRQTILWWGGRDPIYRSRTELSSLLENLRPFHTISPFSGILAELSPSVKYSQSCMLRQMKIDVQLDITQLNRTFSLAQKIDVNVQNEDAHDFYQW